MMELQKNNFSWTWKVLIMFVCGIIALIVLRNIYIRDLRIKKRIKKRKYKKHCHVVPLSKTKFLELADILQIKKNVQVGRWTEWIKDSISTFLRTRMYSFSTFPVSQKHSRDVKKIKLDTKYFLEKSLNKNGKLEKKRPIYFAIVPLSECSFQIIDKQKNTITQLRDVYSKVIFISNHNDIFVESPTFDILVLCLSTFPLLQ